MDRQGDDHGTAAHRPWPHTQRQPSQLRHGPVQRMYFVTYSSVHQQVADEQTRLSLAQQHRRGYEQRAVQEARELEDTEVARAADARATTERVRAGQAARMQLQEAELRAADQEQEQQEWVAVVQEEGRSRRRLEFTVWEGRVRDSLLGIYWEMAEEIDRWAVATQQWKVRKVQQLRYQVLWDQGRVRYRAQEEGENIWYGEVSQVRGIIEWHVTCKEAIVREGLLGQAELGWSAIGAAELSGRQACQDREGMIGVEGDIRGRILEETWIGLLKVRAAARRERSRIQE